MYVNCHLNTQKSHRSTSQCFAANDDIPFIRKRDKSAYKWKEAGHWEADTVVSGLGKSKACFVTLAERKTRYYIALKLPDKKAATVEEGIVKLLSQFPPQLVKSITCDRGTELANWANIEQRL